MRVVAGLYGGLAIKAPRGAETRPTSDRVREAVFSMLGPIEGERVLDLYAGSGAMALEALSRGAAEATLVENARAALNVIRDNIQALGVEAEVQGMSAAAWLDAAKKRGRQYDLVFVDPPYRLASTVGPALQLTLPPILAPGAWVVVESDRRDPLELGLPLVRERRYGDTLITIHRLE